MTNTTLSYELKNQIDNLMNDYIQCIDDDQLEYWPEFFTDSCLYQIIPRENHVSELPAAVIWCDSKGMLQDRVTALRNANIYQEQWYRHIISNPKILSVKDDTIYAQSNYAVFKTCNDGESVVYNVGRYLDVIVHDNNELKFKERSVIFDTHKITTLLAIPI